MKKLSEQPGGIDNIYGNKGSTRAAKAQKKYFGDDDDKITHSRYYHNYFRGWTEIRTETPGHKYKPYKIERIYTAPWTEVDEPRIIYFYYVLSYVILAAVSIVCYVRALTDIRVAGNASVLVAIPGMPTVIPMFLLAVCLIAYIFRKKRMTLYEYDVSTKRLKISALACCIGSGLTALMSAVYLLVKGSSDVNAELKSILFLLLSSAAAAGIWYLEKQLPYKEIPNSTKLPEGEIHEIW